ncbi:cysteine synthase [Megalodesulfovibrio gigas]|uniref:cysteine synthase n=1 Tax=Megalodesulfovibrio gigas (strain ATCC 19364 / DSM 1382 / NCIMB 9332 / VKM B-1759) TaxID=1121448 RepID=T2GEQ0_MEGG1|nr:cysteine synthase [Megalodesulfovibrio gigas]AGW14412.1 putative cysteine synthase [Megalodesulfovibrio gigas DSM 1382 = ATCC 19364]
MHHENVLTAVGQTPLVRINRVFSKPGVTILAKLEARNPGGSIKDRVALAMVEAAERQGLLGPDKIIIEATSGNTGVGLAMVCAVKGYKLRLLMPETASAERKMIMQAYGAEIQLTPGHLSTDGAIEETYRLAREHPETYVLMDQFNNPASVAAHYDGTGREIWEQTEGKVTHVVATLGTSGTVMGIAKRMRACNPAIQVIALEPRPGHALQGLKNMQASYPPGIYDKKVPDRIVRVEDDESFEMCRRLAREEGLLVGMSSGAAMVGAIKVAQELEEGLVVVLFPDSGERYLSTPLFARRPQAGLHLHDRRTGQPVYLESAPRPLGLYTMAPPLDAIHIMDDPEPWRRMVHLDVLARQLRARGVDAQAVAGVADLDDRALAAARAEGVSREALSEARLKHFAWQAEALGCRALGFFPASKAVPRLLEIAEKLLSKGAAYEKLRSVYFDVLRFPEYGQLSHTDLEKLSLGKTVDLADYVKENPKDFTLLKRVSLQDLKHGDLIPTSWGNVRPSWFLQLAAVALEALPRLSVFLAGQAHSFPHLENFRAIWRLGAGVEPLAWVTLQSPAGTLDPALLPAIPPRALRLWLLSAAPSKSLQLSAHNLEMWTANWNRIQQAAAVLVELAAQPAQSAQPAPAVKTLCDELTRSFQHTMDEACSLHRHWPTLLRGCRRILSQASTLTPGDAAALWQTLCAHDDILGLLDHSRLPLPASAWPAEVAALVAEREAARRAKDYPAADRLREALQAAGCRVEDTPHGPRIYKE